MALNDSGDPKKAQEHFETSLKHNPRNADCLYELGRLQQQRGAIDVEKAESFYKRALEIDPNHKKAKQAYRQIQDMLE
jgi:tetratricopeptide (TPR) repeat protein